MLTPQCVSAHHWFLSCFWFGTTLWQHWSTQTAQLQPASGIHIYKWLIQKQLLVIYTWFNAGHGFKRLVRGLYYKSAVTHGSEDDLGQNASSLAGEHWSTIHMQMRWIGKTGLISYHKKALNHLKILRGGSDWFFRDRLLNFAVNTDYLQNS